MPDKENKQILSNFRKEFESFGKDYKPNARQAAEMYAQYQPSQLQEDFVSLRSPETTSYSENDGNAKKQVGSADKARLEVQNQFLGAISSGNRKQAIRIALDAEKNNIGIPLSYFNDMLDRDRLMRLAYEQDNEGISSATIGPSQYRAVPEAAPTKPGFAMEPRPQFASMDQLASSPVLREDVKRYQQKTTGIR